MHGNTKRNSWQLAVGTEERSKQKQEKKKKNKRRN
jgi:hypothetical protein